jgi:hypothetical protein
MVHTLGSLQAAFAKSAGGRRRRAREHPTDAVRNTRAALVLDRLADTVKNVHPDYATAYAELHDSDPSDAMQIIRMEREMIKSAGFYRNWGTAEDFVKEIIARMTGGGTYLTSKQ